MKKYVAFLVLIIGMAGFVAVQDYRASKYRTSEPANGGQSVPTGSDEINPKEHIYDPERDAPSWYGMFRWPNGTTTWAIILTLLVIAEQTSETRRSAEATERTLTHMKDSSAQWVEFEPDGLFTTTEKEQPDPPTIVTINPRWKISNTTSLPLYLKTVEVRIARDEGWKTFVFDFEGEPIPPSKSGNYRAIFASLSLNTAETASFFNNCIELSIATKVSFDNAAGTAQDQHFGDMYVCSVGKLEINHPIGKGPQRQYVEKYDSPSTLVEETGFRYIDDPAPKRN